MPEWVDPQTQRQGFRKALRDGCRNLRGTSTFHYLSLPSANSFHIESGASLIKHEITKKCDKDNNYPAKDC